MSSLDAFPDGKTEPPSPKWREIPGDPIEDGSFVALEEDENGRLESASAGEDRFPAPRSEDGEESPEVSRIPRDTLIETVRGLPPEAELREPIDGTGKLEVYQGEIYIGHLSLEDGCFVAYDVLADPEERNSLVEEEGEGEEGGADG